MTNLKPDGMLDFQGLYVYIGDTMEGYYTDLEVIFQHEWDHINRR